MIKQFLKRLFVPTIENKLPMIRGEALTLRPMPAGAKIHYQAQDGVKLSVPGYRRSMVKWSLLFAAIFFFVVIPALTFGTVHTWQGSYGNTYSDRNWFMTIVLFGSVPFLFIWAYRFLKPRIVIIARGDRICVAGGNSEDGMIFDTKHYSGMAQGHEMKSGKVKDQTGLGFFTGLKVTYGNWGEETPFMFQKGRGVEYLLWMNALIEPVVTGGAVHESELGERAQAF